MKNILFLTDFSNISLNAFEYSLNLLNNEKNINIHLLHAYNIEFNESTYIMQVKDEIEEDSKHKLNDIEKSLKSEFPNFSYYKYCNFGPLCDVVNLFLEDHPIDLIVIGCKGESALENFILGSNAFDIIKNIKIPILAIPANYKFKKPKKLLFSADFSGIIEKVNLKPIIYFIKKHSLDLFFINITTNINFDKVENEKRVSSYFPDIPISFNYKNGSNIQTMVYKFMYENNIEIAVVARHKMGLFERFFSPSTTKSMILHPEFPLFVLHEK